MRFKLIFVFLLVIFCATPIFAERLPLADAITTALNTNPDLQTAKARRDSARAKIPQALSLDDPLLGLEYEKIPSGSRNLEDGMKMYMAEQMIMFPGKIYAEWQMAKAEAVIQEANYQAKVLELSAQVKSSYYELFYTERAIEVMAEIKGLLSGVKKSAEAKYVVGAVAQVEVLMANIEYLMMENELINLRQERSVKEARLNALLNRSDGVTIEAEAVLAFHGTIEPDAALEKKAAANRPELLAMKAELWGQDSAHLKSRMGYFPDTTLKVKKRVADGWDAMAYFSVPLYFWKQGYGVNSVGLEREAAEAAYNNMKNMTVWMVKESRLMADSARRTARLFEDKIIPQNSQALKAALAGYQTGKVDFQTLLYVERGYKEAKLKMYESQVKYGKALAELERITGGEVK